MKKTKAELICKLCVYIKWKPNDNMGHCTKEGFPIFQTEKGDERMELSHGSEW